MTDFKPPRSDAEKLELLADWLDREDATGRWGETGSVV